MLLSNPVVCDDRWNPTQSARPSNGSAGSIGQIPTGSGRTVLVPPNSCPRPQPAAARGSRGRMPAGQGPIETQRFRSEVREPWWSHVVNGEAKWRQPRPRRARTTPGLRPLAAVALPMCWCGPSVLELLCETQAVLCRCSETFHPPTYYLPPDAVSHGIGLSPCPAAASANGKVWPHYFDLGGGTQRIQGSSLALPRANSGLRGLAACMPLSSPDGRWLGAMERRFTTPGKGASMGGWITSTVTPVQGRSAPPGKTDLSSSRLVMTCRAVAP